MTIIDLVNAIPDALRLGIMPALRILAVLLDAQLFEDGSMIP